MCTMYELHTQATASEHRLICFNYTFPMLTRYQRVIEYIERFLLNESCKHAMTWYVTVMNDFAPSVREVFVRVCMCGV